MITLGRVVITNVNLRGFFFFLILVKVYNTTCTIIKLIQNNELCFSISDEEAQKQCGH